MQQTMRVMEWSAWTETRPLLRGMSVKMSWQEIQFEDTIWGASTRNQSGSHIEKETEYYQRDTPHEIEVCLIVDL